MQNSTTLTNEHGAQVTPRKETLRFILDYSKALKVESLKCGIDVCLIRN